MAIPGITRLTTALESTVGIHLTMAVTMATATHGRILIFNLDGQVPLAFTWVTTGITAGAQATTMDALTAPGVHLMDTEVILLTIMEEAMATGTLWWWSTTVMTDSITADATRVAATLAERNL